MTDDNNYITSYRDLKPEYIESILKDKQILYIFNQYDDNNALNKLFKTFQNELKGVNKFICTWLFLKSNQDNNVDIPFSEDYFYYMCLNLLNTPFAFGNPISLYQYDSELQDINYDDPEIKYDATLSKAFLPVRRFKAIFRLLQDIRYYTFNIFRFAQMVKEYCYTDTDLQVTIDPENSFPNPTTTVIFINRETQSIIEFKNTILRMFNDYFPMQTIVFKLKGDTNNG